MKLKACLPALSLALLSTTQLHATDFLTTYQEAAQNNGTYLAAEATYKAAGYGVPIARAALLPTLQLTANTAANRQSPASSEITGSAEAASYNTNQYQLQLTQPLIDISSWYTYGQAEATYKSAAITYAEAEQTLITSTASAYFGVLEAEDQLKYAEANQESLQEQLTQTEAQYKVGLKALTDVESTQASYESAVAQTIADQNALSNAYENLAVITGKPETNLAPLKQNFPLLNPEPANIDDWVHFGLKNNLSLQSAVLASEIAKLGIRINQSGYAPTLNAQGTYLSTHSNQYIPVPAQRSTTKSAALNVAWNVFTGGSTYFSVKQSKYTYQENLANQEQTLRTTDTGVRQAYLNVLSDISQIEAYQQAVISGQVSLRAMKAGYLVGTRTIVDVLTQQSNLFDSEQEYTQAIYDYINDSLNLKEQAGLLAPTDVAAINGWLAVTPESPSALKN